MRFSILIPSIPERLNKVKYLYDKLKVQIGERPIEVLSFTDNMKRSIGMKRNGVKSLINGDYFSFIDDDDDISGDYIESIWQALEQEPDVVTFKQECKNADGSTFIVTFGVGNEIEHNGTNGGYNDINRPPFQMCVFKTDIFKQVNFSDKMYGRRS